MINKSLIIGYFLNSTCMLLQYMPACLFFVLLLLLVFYICILFLLPFLFFCLGNYLHFGIDT